MKMAAVISRIKKKRLEMEKDQLQVSFSVSVIGGKK